MVGPDRADDVIQDAFLRLSRSLKDTEIKNPRAFLYRICANLATDELRRRRRQLDYQRSMVDQPESHAPAAAETADLREQLEQVQRAVDSLPPKCRRVFVLRKFKDHSYAEISALEGISVKTVENQISRALKLIRERIKHGTH
jgi:RNA polymerase sigma-70 factor (ECF subfamily)